MLIYYVIVFLFFYKMYVVYLYIRIKFNNFMIFVFCRCLIIDRIIFENLNSRIREGVVNLNG